MGMRADGDRTSFWGDGMFWNGIEVMADDAALKTRSGRLTWAHCEVRELYFNEAVIKLQQHPGQDSFLGVGPPPPHRAPSTVVLGPGRGHSRKGSFWLLGIRMLGVCVQRACASPPSILRPTFQRQHEARGGVGGCALPSTCPGPGARAQPVGGPPAPRKEGQGVPRAGQGFPAARRPAPPPSTALGQACPLGFTRVLITVPPGTAEQRSSGALGCVLCAAWGSC
ncbi:hypothetical protein VULLAG_LOCUS2604 [Vulpes lagopus]